MGLTLENLAGGVTSAATGGAWSSDGKSGYMQGGKGVVDSFNKLTNTSAFTDWIPGIGDKKAQEEANKLNLAESQRNRDFQERMSSSAYQRGMADMKKAGLNPTLAYMQGGASAPTGAQASVNPASSTALGDFALKTLTGVGGLRNQTTALQQQNSMNESSIALNTSTAAKNVADAEKTRTETKGLGRKEEEGKLWKKFYKGLNSIMDTTSKDTKPKFKMPTREEYMQKTRKNLKPH